MGYDIYTLKQLRGGGTEMISLYIPGEYHMSIIRDFLRQERSSAERIKRKETRKNVQSALERINEGIKGIERAPENGFIIFCVRSENNDILEIIVPKNGRVMRREYLCDSRFHTEIFEEIEVPSTKIGVLMVDRSEMELFVVRNKRAESLYDMESLVPSQHRHGGQSAPRFQRGIENAVKDFLTEVSKKANEIFLPMNLDKLIIAGPSFAKEELSRLGILRKELLDISEIHSVGYVGINGLRELFHKTTVFGDTELNKYVSLIERFRLKLGSGGIISELTGLDSLLGYIETDTPIIGVITPGLSREVYARGLGIPPNILICDPVGEVNEYLKLYGGGIFWRE